MENPQSWVDAGAWVGRQQAFAIIAQKCSAAQALALKEVKEARLFESLGLSWDDFCKQYAGISRTHAERLIHQYNEFGEAYFRLSELACISPETYRQIAAQVEEETIELEGERLSLTRENAPRIRAGIQKLRSKLRHAREFHSYSPEIAELRARLESMLRDAKRILDPEMPTDGRNLLHELTGDAIEKWTALRRHVETCR